MNVIIEWDNTIEKRNDEYSETKTGHKCLNEENKNIGQMNLTNRII